jgi:uncharacterized membrane protein YtjA (UPF0391 family)
MRPHNNHSPGICGPIQENVMLYYAVVFFIIAIVAAIFGFSGLAAGAAGIAKILFVVFLVIAIATFVANLLRGR